MSGGNNLYLYYNQSLVEALSFAADLLCEQIAQ